MKLTQALVIAGNQFQRIAPDLEVPESFARLLEEMCTYHDIAEFQPVLFAKIQEECEPLVRVALNALRDNISPAIEAHLKAVEEQQRILEGMRQAVYLEDQAKLEAAQAEEQRVAEEAAMVARSKLKTELRTELLQELRAEKVIP